MKLKPFEQESQTSSNTTNKERRAPKREDGCYPERAIIMEELYQKSGRAAEDHPMHGLFIGLANENGKVPDNNSE